MAYKIENRNLFTSFVLLELLIQIIMVLLYNLDFKGLLKS